MPDSGCTSRIDNLTVMGEMTAGGTMEISNSNIRGNFDFSTGKTYVGRFNSYRGDFTARGLKGFNKTKRDSATGTVKFEGAGSESFLDWLFSSGQEVEIKDFANLKAEGIGSKSKIENIKFAEIKSGESELKNICHAIVDGGKYKATDSLVLCKGGSVEATNTIVINAGGTLDESSSNALSIEKGYRIYAKDIQLTVESNVELNCKAPVINVLGEMRVYVQSPDITFDCPMVTFTGDFNTPSVPSYNSHVHPGIIIGPASTQPPV
jgi:hypothetical protein